MGRVSAIRQTYQTWKRPIQAGQQEPSTGTSTAAVPSNAPPPGAPLKVTFRVPFPTDDSLGARAVTVALPLASVSNCMFPVPENVTSPRKGVGVASPSVIWTSKVTGVLPTNAGTMVKVITTCVLPGAGGVRGLHHARITAVKIVASMTKPMVLATIPHRMQTGIPHFVGPRASRAAQTRWRHHKPLLRCRSMAGISKCTADLGNSR